MKKNVLIIILFFFFLGCSAYEFYDPTNATVDITYKQSLHEQSASKESYKQKNATLFLEQQNIEFWSLIIGISEYKNQHISNLNYSKKNLYFLLEKLKRSKYIINNQKNNKVLLNNEANYKNIRLALYDWLSNPIHQDIVLIYVNGYVFSGGDNFSDQFIIPYDADPKHISATGISFRDILYGLNEHTYSNNFIFVFDTFIYNKDNNKQFNNACKELANHDKCIAVIKSGSKDKELIYESKNSYSPLTYYLALALNGKADKNNDDIITLYEIESYVSEEVRRHTKNRHTPYIYNNSEIDNSSIKMSN